jgi:hypothetical protein
VDDSTLDCSLLSAPFYVQPSYRDIEWLEIPAEVTWRRYENAPLSRRKVNLSAIRSALESVGTFELEESSHGLRIYGYRP